MADGITIEVRSKEFRDFLHRAATQIGDFTIPNRALAAQLYAETLRNFDNEANGGVPWAPLAESTIRSKAKKGYSRKLQNTGALRASFLPFSTRELAGVGALSTREHADISIVHEFGTDRIPARPMLPSESRAEQVALRVYQFYIDKAVK